MAADQESIRKALQKEVDTYRGHQQGVQKQEARHGGRSQLRRSKKCCALAVTNP